MTSKAERVYIDVEQNVLTSTSRRWDEIEKKMKRRAQIKRLMDKLELLKNEVHEELEATCYRYGVNGLVFDDMTFDIIQNSGRGRWNKSYLVQTLLPQQLEKAYSTGDSYVSLRFTVDEEKAQKIRDSMESDQLTAAALIAIQ